MKRYFLVLALSPLFPVGTYAFETSIGNSINVDMLAETLSGSEDIFSGDLWTYVLQPSHRSYLTDIAALADGDFLAIGTSNSPEGGANGWMMRVKPYGETVWLRTLSYEDTWQQFSGVAVSGSGGVGIAGVTTGNREYSIDGWLVTVDPNGDGLNQKSYGGNHDDWFSAIAATPDGGFVVAGEYGVGEEETQGWLLYLGADGELLHQHIFSMGERSWLKGLTVGADGQVIASGGMITQDKTGDWIIGLSQEAEIDFSYTYLEGHVEASFEDYDVSPVFAQQRSGGLGDIVMLNPDMFVTIGTTFEIDRPRASRDDRLVAFNGHGEKLWEVEAEDGVTFAGLAALDGSVVVVGSSGQDAFGAMFDAAGNMLSRQVFSGVNRQYFEAVASGEAGNIAAVGFSNGFGGVRNSHGLAIGTYPEER